MRRTRTYASDSPLGRLVADLKRLRKGEGLTRSKVAEAREVLRLPVVHAEAQRLGRRPEEVAFALIVLAVHSPKSQAGRDYLINAYALDNTPPGKNVSDRRSRFGLSESQVREHEDDAIEELGRWLLVMTDPATLFGDYLAPEVGLPATEWQTGALVEPAPRDEVHPLGEVTWDYLEKTCVLNERGFALYTETRGLLRAMLDGVTGYTVFYTNADNPEPKTVRVLEGGTPGMHAEDVLGTRALNINFHEPLPMSRTLRLHWLIELPPPSTEASPQRGMAEVADVHTRHLTLRVQFDDRKLPVRPRYYQARPRFLLRSIGPVRPLELQPGNLITYTWPRTEEGLAYVLTWSWPEDFGSDKAEGV